MVRFKNYSEKDYQAVFDFLIELNNINKNHINWNWARFEWMYEHPEFDKSAVSSIGLWWDNDKVIGAAIYDMYFGEAFCAVLPKYNEYLEDVYNYAFKNLSDEEGIGIAINDSDLDTIGLVKKLGFEEVEQNEVILSFKLDKKLQYNLFEGIRICELDPVLENDEFSWILWQGFDHGINKEEFELNDSRIIQNRKHFKRELSLCAKNEKCESVAYTSLWYDEKTDYAYIEPLCTIPSYRGKGIAKALLMEAMSRVKAMGANICYVISDLDFYKKIGFLPDMNYKFYWKK